MKPTLVTGATGFLGWHVARQLLDRGDRVRALARDPKQLRELDGVEPMQGDLLDPSSLQRAVEGCRAVYHVAADYRLWVRDAAPMYRANVDGTRALLDASKAAGVERVVYTSTVGCIGIPKDASRPCDNPQNGAWDTGANAGSFPGREGRVPALCGLANLGDESKPVGIEEMTGHYKRSKFLAEEVALESARSGFPVVIVNPTAPIGDHDFKPTPTGKIVVDFIKGAMPAYLDTGLNVVDAKAVARGHLLAFERGKPGERYILGAENLTLQQIFASLSQIVGRPAPKTQIPYAVAYLAGLVYTGIANVTGKEPRAPLDGVRMARKKMWVSCDKAIRELGYQPGTARTALENAANWFRANGYC